MPVVRGLVPLARLATRRAHRALSSTALRTADEARFPSYVLQAPATEVTALPNGVRVASEVRAARGQGREGERPGARA